MILVIGGYSQGKLDYVKKRFSKDKVAIVDAKSFSADITETENNNEKKIVIDNINELVKNSVIDKKNPEDEIKKLLHKFPDSIIISDEVGNGIVPIDKTERLFRETIGRMQCILAEQAEEVIRVICGIGQKIK